MKWRALLQDLFVPSIVIGRTGHVAYANRSAEELFGWGSKAWRGQVLQSRFPLAFQASQKTRETSTFEDLLPVPEPYETMAVTQSGEKKPVLLRVTPSTSHIEPYKVLFLTDKKRMRKAPDLDAMPLFRSLWPASNSPCARESRLQRFVEELAVGLDFPFAAIEFLDETGERLVLHGVWGKEINPLATALHVPIHETLRGYTAKTGKEAAFSFPAGRFIPDDEPFLEENSRTFICHPLKDRRRTIGILTLIHTEDLRIQEDFHIWLRSLSDYLMDYLRSEAQSPFVGG
jgi:PAS domain S-box-containing protein